MSKKILVVDDEFFIYQMISTYLNAKGYETVWAKNGQLGLEMFQEENPDMVMADILMPKLNGPDMVQKIRKIETGKKIPIIMMTSMVKSFTLQRNATTKWGADDYLQKPFELELLLKKVVSYIGAGERTTARIVKSPATEKSKSTHGTFTDRSYAKILHYLYKNRATGKLELSSDRKRVIVYFENGNPFGVRSNYIKEGTLTKILLKLVDISKSQVEQSRKVMKVKGLQQGEALVEMGVITQDTLCDGLKFQAKEKMLAPFQWKEATYAFVEGLIVQDPDLMLETSLPRIVLEGITQYYSSDRIREALDKRLKKTFVKNPTSRYNLEDFEFNPRELEVVHLAENGQTVAEVLSLSPINVLRSLQILYVLFLLGVFKFTGEEPVRDQSAKSKKKPSGRKPGISPDNPYQKAIDLVRQGDFVSAADILDAAVKKETGIAKYYALYGLAVQLMPKDESRFYPSSIKLVKKAVKLDPDCIETNIAAGKHAKNRKELHLATKYFEKVLHSDPENIEANRELNLIRIKIRKDARYV